MNERKTPVAILGGTSWLSLETPRPVSGRLLWTTRLRSDFEMKTGLIFVALVAVVVSSLWIRDLSEADSSRAVVHLVVLTVISLFFLVPAIRRSQHTIRLLQNGKPGLATTAHVVENSSKDYGRLIQVDFVFVAPDGSEQTRQVRLPRSAQERLTDDAEEPCLYDADDFSRFVVLDELPGEVRVSDNGGLESNLAQSEPWGMLVVPGFYYVIGMFVYPWVHVLGI